MGYSKIRIPPQGRTITFENGKLNVPDNPVVAYMEGDGSGFDIWAASVRVFDAAVEKVYGSKRKIAWMEIYAGEKAVSVYGPGQWLPGETLDALQQFRIAFMGPMNPPLGGGIGAINAAIHQRLDLYACLRRARYFKGLPSPVKRPEDIDMTIFRENLEDVYAEIELEGGSPAAEKMKLLLEQESLLKKVRFPDSASFGIKPASKDGAQRLTRAAIRYAIEQKLPSVTIVHKGNVMKFTEGMFAKWGYEVAREEFPGETISWEDCGGNPPPGLILIKDVLADVFLHKILTRPSDFSVIAAMNLNGDYISSVLAGQVGQFAVASEANINYESGCAIFEATHCTASKYAGLDKVNPLSLILSGVMMFNFMGWKDVADKIEKAVEKVLAQKTVTYDYARFMEGAREVPCSGFADVLVKNM